MAGELFIGGKWLDSKDVKNIQSPFNGETVFSVCSASDQQIELALGAAENARVPFSKTSRFARHLLLKKMAALIARDKRVFVDLLIHEAGKPKILAEVEVSRAIGTFEWASEEAKRFCGDLISIDYDQSHTAFAPAKSLFFPRGVVLGITPFNFPLNLVAHKVAPALAVGAPIIIKCAPQTPGAALHLASLFEEVLQDEPLLQKTPDQIPKHALQIVYCTNEQTEKMVTDSRIATVSFTGSATVGWMLQSKAIRKKLCLELGGNAAVIVEKDADLNRAAKRIVAGAYGYAGQSCISVQRLFVEKSVYTLFKTKLFEEIKALKVGDPLQSDVVVGPVIDSKSKKRILDWIDSAVSSGAELITGGESKDNVIDPVLMEYVPHDLPLYCEEVFGPVAMLESFTELEEAIQKINDSKYGLQASIFTDSKKKIDQVVANLEVGGVVINEVSSFRADAMPYGGVKDSGLGREGLRYAMEEFCERKTVVEFLS